MERPSVRATEDEAVMIANEEDLTGETLVKRNGKSMQTRMFLAVNAASKRNEMISWLAGEVSYFSQLWKTTHNRLKSERANHKRLVQELRNAKAAAHLAQQENEELRAKVRALQDFISIHDALRSGAAE